MEGVLFWPVLDAGIRMVQSGWFSNREQTFSLVAKIFFMTYYPRKRWRLPRKTFKPFHLIAFACRFWVQLRTPSDRDIRPIGRLPGACGACGQRRQGLAVFPGCATSPQQHGSGRSPWPCLR